MEVVCFFAGAMLGIFVGALACASDVRNQAVQAGAAYYDRTGEFHWGVGGGGEGERPPCEKKED